MNDFPEPVPQAHETLILMVELATALQQNKHLDRIWSLLSDALNKAFSHTFCTVLSYDPETNTLLRLYSSRPDVHRPGGRKKVIDSPWSRKVLQKGEVLIGSTAGDIKSYFSEHEVLLANGWESILNIPVRKAGKTIGSVNLMNGAHKYDDANQGLGKIFAQLVVTAMERASEAMESSTGEKEDPEYV